MRPARPRRIAVLARGALTAALALVAVAAAPAPAEAAFEPPLPALDITDTYVTGISSGGFMASQLQIANSAAFKGAAVFATGPYYCGQGSILHGLAECTGLASTDPAGIVATARRWSEQGKIDPVAHLAGKPVYTYHGTKDPLVSERMSDEGVQVHRQLGARIAYHDTDPAGHGWPRPDGALPCGTTFYPFLIDCGNDPQGELLTHWLGSVRPPAATQTGTLSEHDQDRYTPGGWAQLYSLGSKSFLYTPDSCAAGKPCKLVVALHGCLSDNKFVGDRFARESYLNEYADTNDLVILYPQTDVSVARGNPQGCWDWWGYTGSDYAQKSAPQMRMIMNQVRALKR
ncbi:PHB depolymerase family esterase [Streptomyces sp. N35]|uniref:extracellular catalytic domain type 2 short-chain-length polyhydroxyalkanoate depolymerase n=1 Tax=Streptomyces sp. N35 TaxID=2795730 RepID=UPI0018F589A5|nr:PHB depolymerase family esterase [Streptomyces sp. N35]